VWFSSRMVSRVWSFWSSPVHRSDIVLSSIWNLLFDQSVVSESNRANPVHSYHVLTYPPALTAANHTLFICITVLTAVFYILSLFAERWLRHMDRLPEDVRRREQILDWFAILFGTIGGIALILLGVVSSAAGFFR
jgi:hypothetical protein